LFKKFSDLMSIVGKKKWFLNKIKEWYIKFIFIDEIINIKINNWILTPLNLFSEKVEQYGFFLEINWHKILFFWDENIWVIDRKDLFKYKNSDLLLSEATCTKWDMNIFKPYDRFHINSQDAWKIWTLLNVKNIIISHIAEKDWISRKNHLNEIKEDVSKTFKWNIFVPIDSEKISIKL
jgi:ribonuclease Z